MSPVTIGGAPQSPLTLVTATPDLGQALINNPPGPIPNGILTWTAPNDGNLHVVQLLGFVVATVNSTGGQLKVFFHSGGPNGGFVNSTVQAGGVQAGAPALFSGSFPVDPGTSFFFQQQTALSGGAAICYATLTAV